MLAPSNHSTRSLMAVNNWSVFVPYGKKRPTQKNLSSFPKNDKKESDRPSRRHHDTCIGLFVKAIILTSFHIRRWFSPSHKSCTTCLFKSLIRAWPWLIGHRCNSPCLEDKVLTSRGCFRSGEAKAKQIQARFDDDDSAAGQNTVK